MKKYAIKILLLILNAITQLLTFISIITRILLIAWGVLGFISIIIFYINGSLQNYSSSEVIFGIFCFFCSIIISMIIKGPISKILLKIRKYIAKHYYDYFPTEFEDNEIYNYYEENHQFNASNFCPAKPSDFDFMTGEDFEIYCGNLLSQNGYHNVSITPTTNDHGVDLLTRRNNNKYAIQCKRYSSPVGTKAVQEAHSGAAYHNCDKAVVLTNNYFTPSAKDHALKTGVILWDFDELLKLINDAYDTDSELLSVENSESASHHSEENIINFQHYKNSTYE